MRTLNVLLIDDEPGVLELLRRWIQREPDLLVCAEATDGAGAVRLARIQQPDVIVTDWHLPDAPGHAVVAALADACPTARIVVYTSDDRVTDAAEEAGAHRVVVKGGGANELMAVVRG